MNQPHISRAAAAAVFELLESRTLFAATGYEPINGVGNNLAHPTWGSAGSDLLRLAPDGYADGVSSLANPEDLSPRQISNIINSQADPSDPSQDLTTIDGNNLSDFGYAFGQFIDHDLDFTNDGTEPDPIAVAAGDPIGPDPLFDDRSQYDPATGTSTSNPRQQVTDVTSYLDLSQVYGSDLATELDLRTMSGGLMKTSPGGLLPYLNSTYFTPSQLASLNAYDGGMQDLGPLPSTQMFATGDVRGDENLEFTAINTLFVRNHNRIAGELSAEHPTWSDEQLFQEARKINIAEYQNIVYTEYLPALLGQNAIPQYAGYNPNVDAGIANEFSTVAFRVGHSMVSPTIARDANDGTTAQTPISLAVDFYDPDLLTDDAAVDPYTGYVSSSLDQVLKGEADGNGQAVDSMVINEVRNTLFGNGQLGGSDLVALDIQRGRDNGIPNYNALRVAMGLKPVTSFAQITSNVTVQNELAEAYPGGVNTIDAIEGGMAEDHVAGSDVGPLFQAIIVNQFTRLEAGDRYFYLNEGLNADELNLIAKGSTLTKIIEANTDVTNLQPDAFLFTASIGGTVVSAPPALAALGTGTPVAGVTVNLLRDGSVVATTTTNSAGAYLFTQQAGLTTGDWTLSFVPPAGMMVASAAPGTILISAGGQHQTYTCVLTTTPANTPVALSSLKPTSATVGWGTLQDNLSIKRNPITLRGVVYPTGLGAHASSTITYDLAGQYGTFSSAVGVDDETNGQGAVDFQVFGDGKLLYDSGVLTGTSPVANLSVNVSGVQTLTLVASPGFPGTIDYDHADWAGAELLGTAPAATVPPTPTGLTAVATSSTSVSLHWSNLAANQTGYSIDRSADGGTTWTPVATAGATATSYTDAGLTPGTTYEYRCRATNATGSSAASGTATATTLGSGAAATPISALTPVSETVGWGALQQNLSIKGNPITLRGTVYASGLGAHASSTIVYALGGQYATFQSDVGIDDDSNGQGAVDFQVYGDGKLLYDSGVLSGTSPAAHVSVGVAGVQTLTLVALPGVAGTIDYDHADWAGAELIATGPVRAQPTPSPTASPASTAVVEAASNKVLAADRRAAARAAAKAQRADRAAQRVAAAKAKALAKAEAKAAKAAARAAKLGLKSAAATSTVA